MKLLHLSLLLFSALILNGCISEDLSDCEPEIENNLILKFILNDENSKDIFAEKIKKVDLFVYNSDSQLVQTKTVDQASLSTFAGTDLSLEPGTYRIVSWGNAFDKTYFSGVQSGDSFNDAALINSAYPKSNVALNGDSLYYAPQLLQAFTVTVSNNEVLTKELPFSNAHIKIRIYIKGFVDESSTGEVLLPLVALTDVSSGYNFNRVVSSSMITYEDKAKTTKVNGKDLDFIEFSVPLFTKDTPSLLLIKKQSDGTTLTTVNIKDFIEQYNIDLTKTIDLVVPIEIEYLSVGVSITLPGWKDNSVKPEY